MTQKAEQGWSGGQGDCNGGWSPDETSAQCRVVL